MKRKHVDENVSFGPMLKKTRVIVTNLDILDEDFDVLQSRGYMLALIRGTNLSARFVKRIESPTNFGLTFDFVPRLWEEAHNKADEVKAILAALPSCLHPLILDYTFSPNVRRFCQGPYIQRLMQEHEPNEMVWCCFNAALYCIWKNAGKIALREKTITVRPKHFEKLIKMVRTMSAFSLF